MNYESQEQHDHYELGEETMLAETSQDTPPDYNQSQLYILINALENLMIPSEEHEYNFIRNDLLSRFRKQLKEHKAKYENNA